MKRGSVVTVAAQGDYGKPRPAVIVQTDALNSTHGTFLLCPVTSRRAEAPDLWIDVEPLPENGLRHRSQIMADRIVTVRREKIGKIVGEIDKPTMQKLTQVLSVLLGIVG